jgi:hypothetical protein
MASGYAGAFILMAMLLCGAVALAQQQASIGQVTALQGQATVQHQASSQATSLHLRSPVYPEDIIQTAAASKLKLSLTGDIEITLGEQSSLTLSRFVYAPQQKYQNVLLRLTQGAFRMITRTLFPQAAVEVHTPTAVAAIRGTDWLGQVTPEATAVLALRGKVAVTSAFATVPGEVLLTSGMGTDIQAMRPPTAPKKWPGARVQTLLRATTLP